MYKRMLHACVLVSTFTCTCNAVRPFQARFEASYAECPRLMAIVAAVASHPAVRAVEARRAAAAAASAAS
jgi:hypothetical protein